MPVPGHLEEAVSRLEGASARIERARASPADMETLREWLDALTAYAEALSDIHRFTNESVHEKLHALAARLKVEQVLYGGGAAPLSSE